MKKSYLYAATAWALLWPLSWLTLESGWADWLVIPAGISLIITIGALAGHAMSIWND